MKTGRPQKAPIYTLPHGIEVIGEYEARGSHCYWRVRIRPHRFFPGVRLHNGGIYVTRSRVVLASKLGRALKPDEHAHHRDEDRSNDSPRNLRLLTAAQHNSLHKTGVKRSLASRAKQGASLRKAYEAGRRIAPGIKKRDALGRASA